MSKQEAQGSGKKTRLPVFRELSVGRTEKKLWTKHKLWTIINWTNVFIFDIFNLISQPILSLMYAFITENWCVYVLCERTYKTFSLN